MKRNSFNCPSKKAGRGAIKKLRALLTRSDVVNIEEDRQYPCCNWNSNDIWLGGIDIHFF